MPEWLSCSNVMSDLGLCSLCFELTISLWCSDLITVVHVGRKESTQDESLHGKPVYCFYTNFMRTYSLWQCAGPIFCLEDMLAETTSDFLWMLSTLIKKKVKTIKVTNLTKLRSFVLFIILNTILGLWL